VKQVLRWALVLSNVLALRLVRGEILKAQRTVRQTPVRLEMRLSRMMTQACQGNPATRASIPRALTIYSRRPPSPAC
jgi:hypothetical protein